MRLRLSRLAAPAAYLSALVLIWLSFASYSSQFTPVGRWAADANDPADYRFIAEYFWGVPFPSEDLRLASGTAAGVTISG